MTDSQTAPTCPSCGKEIPPRAEVCGACGYRLSERLCSGCGEVSVAQGLDLCHACRAKMEVDLPLEELDEDALGEPCPECGHRSYVEQTFCDECGADLPEGTTIALKRDVPRERVSLVGEGAFVGRSDAIERLEALATEALQGEGCRISVVLGEPGAGKSRLLDELARRLEALEEPPRIFRISCREGADNPYDPLPRILQERFGIDTSLDDIGQRIAVTRLIGSAFGTEGASWVTETSHMLGHLAGVAFPQSPVLRSLQGDYVRFGASLQRAMSRFVEADSAENPSVWIIDDLHVASAEVRKLISRLPGALEKGRHFILAAGLPELKKSVRSAEEARVELEPLDDQAMGRLLVELLPELPDPPQELVEAAVDRASGNPASLREIARHLLESGVIDATSTPWHTDLARLDASDLPVSLTDALRARRQRLDPRDRAVLERAAVIGDVFWDEALLALGRGVSPPPTEKEPAEIWPDDTDMMSLEATLHRLEEGEFVLPLEGSEFPRVREYVFRHAGAREQIYTEIAPVQRRTYHLLAAQWLETMAGTRSDQLLDQLAEHWERGGDQRRATAAWVDAARYAQDHFLNHKAADLLERALGSLSDEDRTLRVSVLEDLGTIYELIGSYDAASSRLSEMLRDAWALVDRSRAGTALNKMGRIFRAKGDYPAARAYFERGLALYRAADDMRGVATSLDDLGNVYWLVGQYNRALEQGAEALEIRRRLNDRRGEGVSLLSIGRTEMARGFVNEADACYREALQIAQRIGDRETECKAWNSIGAVMHARGQYEEAIELWRTALQLAEEVGDRRMQSFVLNNLGEALTTIGDRTEAERCLMECEALAVELEDRRALSEVYRNLGLLMMRHNETERAREHLESSLRTARVLGSKEAVGLALRALGELATLTVFDDAGDDGADKEAYFHQAVTIFERLGNELELATTLKSLGTYWLERGDAGKARDSLVRARDILARIDSAEAARIEVTIEELDLEVETTARDNPLSPLPEGRNDTLSDISIEVPVEESSVSVRSGAGLSGPPTQPDELPSDTDPAIPAADDEK